MKTILCYGDSNTWGGNAETGKRFPRNIRWPGALQNELGDDYYVIEEGLGGRTTVWDDPIEGNKNGLTQLIPVLHSHDPLDLIIIMLGTNDLKNRFSVSAKDIAFSILRLADTVRKSQNMFTSKPPEILVVCPPPVKSLENSPLKDILIGAEKKSAELAGAFREVCQANDIEMLNAGDFAESSDIDGVHLDAENHLKLAKAIAFRIKQILK